MQLKSYTDIEQSRKLAEILPLESADMFYNEEPEDETYPKDIVDTKYPMILREEQKHFLEEYGIPCWSLTALLGVLPKSIPHKDAKYNEDRKYWTYSWLLTSKCLFYKCVILLENGGRYDDVFAEVYHQGNPVDGCYEMIIRLNELNLL